MPRWVLALCVTAACALGAPGGGVSLGAEPGDGATPAVAAASTASPHGTPSSLPLPSSLSLAEYERLLFDFLDSRQYKRLGWRRDKKVRDTGPYRDGVYYGTHPAVFIYYSPEIIEWLEGGQQHAIPDGAMMIKEQYEPPAARWEGMDEDERFERLSSWTVMVKDSAGSHDGWFWSNPGKGQKLVDYFSYPFEEPYSGCGIYCVRCHASTKTAGATNEYTFASLRNVEGYPEEPLEFEIDDSWRQSEEVEEPGPAVAAAEDVDADHEALLLAALEVGSDGTHPRCAVGAQPTPCNPVLNAAFLELFPSIAPRDRTLVQRLPGVTHDWVVRRPGRPEDQPFVTSNQCMSCHAGLVAPFGPTMFHPTGDTAEYGDPGIHISPYGEWRWTPMGLAGRDPVFFAQLESEVEMMREDFADDPALGAELAAELVDTCLTCHGAMGKHQFDIDHGGTAGRFTMAHVLRPMTGADAAGPDHWKYGALARDGISCAVCHQMEARPQPEGDDRTYLEHFLETSITGNIYLGQTNELHGPLEDKEIAPYTMEHALGYTPKHNPYIRSSQMCGSCHVVNLPIIDRPEEPGHAPSVLVAAEKKECFKGYHHHVEQATYLEWLNSVYENEVDVDNPQAKTCQDCHMARDLHHDEWDVHLDRIETQIAAIQDHTYPHAENLAEREHLEIRRRTEGYARHNFRGLNVFLLEMFRQFDDVLGVRKHDFMTGSQLDLQHAIDDFVRQARTATATIAVEARLVSDDQLEASVEIHNLAGHRFPSGVGFRRAFIELLVIEQAAGEAPERIVWSSGRTNELGVLVDDAGEPLPCEFFNAEPGSDKQAFQHHHEVITSPAQVQIYETLLWSAKHRFTTSFIHGSEMVKDNRLLPRGWKKEGPGGGLQGEFLAATWPCPTSLKDPRYTDGSGSDEVLYRIALPAGVDPGRLAVRATLHYQAMPPYFLQSLFETAPHGPATQRLHYICSNIDLRGTPIEGWKLPVVSAAAPAVRAARGAANP